MKSSTELKQFKHAMRRGKASPYERQFCARLDEAQIEHICQCILGFYIADFVVPSRMLVIELDGSSHDGREAYDAKRDAFLRGLGFTVLRIKNRDMATFPLEEIRAYPAHDKTRFRSALGHANNERSKAIRASRSQAEAREDVAALRAKPGFCRRPTCRRCQRPVESAAWRRFKNGSVHLVWWCGECERQAAGNPLPKEWAGRFNLESFETAQARLTLASGVGW